MSGHTSIPHLALVDGSTTLMVHGRPFLMLAGEVHNSTSSSEAWMARAWDKAGELGLNTLLAPVTWELVEPEEGVFDFTVVDALIDQARERGGHLVLLWFGAWKNGGCMYAPEWVKRDTVRFWRAEPIKGQHKVILTDFHDMPYTTLSAFCEATRTADARAFASLMAHIREYDEAQQIVIAVQVENECGLMGAARDHCDAADEVFAGQVPSGLLGYLQAHEDTLAAEISSAMTAGAASGTWTEVFGATAEELFQTYHTARYVEAVAASGKEAYPLPTMANAWLDKGKRPGRFPTGGPNARVMEVWRYAAPSVDILCPDIYVPTFCDVCDSYVKLGNPLAIPETATHAHAAPRLAWTIAHHHALSCSPFGFEEMGEPFSSDIGILFGMDTTDPALRTPQDPSCYAAVANAMSQLFSAVGGYGCMDAVIEERGRQQALNLGSWTCDVTFGEGPGVVAALTNATDEAYLLIMNATVTPRSNDVDLPNVDLLACEDGSFRDGVWVRDRRLNGDETMFVRFEEPTLLRVKVLCYA